MMFVFWKVLRALLEDSGRRASLQSTNIPSTNIIPEHEHHSGTRTSVRNTNIIPEHEHLSPPLRHYTIASLRDFRFVISYIIEFGQSPTQVCISAFYQISGVIIIIIIYYYYCAVIAPEIIIIICYCDYYCYCINKTYV